MPSFIILADDLSGAAELAGLAYGYGLTGEVQREIHQSSVAESIAIDTNSRQLDSYAAADRVRHFTTQLRDLPCSFLYKKTDSLLRGNVRAEIEAIMLAAGLRRTILVPANPSRGRTISGGRYLIDGQPLDQTSLASDPHHPRHSASVVELLDPGAQPVHVAPPYSNLPSKGIIIPDATSTDDLATLATHVDSDTLPAGAADFLQALLKIRVDPSHPSNPCPTASLIRPPALLLCGSLFAWPLRKAACLAAGIPVLHLDEGFFVASREEPAYLVGCGERLLAPQTAVAALILLAATLIENLNVQTLLVEGGETAAALAEKLNWTRFEVIATAPAGVGALRPLATPAPLVLIKPGSYQWPPSIWDEFVAVRF